jgi:hypothetical protein
LELVLGRLKFLLFLPRLFLTFFLLILKHANALNELVQLYEGLFVVIFEGVVQLQNLFGLLVLLVILFLPQGFILVKSGNYLVPFLANCFVVSIDLPYLLVKFLDDLLFL